MEKLIGTQTVAKLTVKINGMVDAKHWRVNDPQRDI